MIHKLQVGLIFIIIPLGFFFWFLNEHDISFTKADLFPGTPIMHLGEIPLNVEIADTPALRSRGLSGKEELDPGYGMLFIFDETTYHQMWMMNMRFPIDIIWVSEDLKVVGIERDLQPSNDPNQKRVRPPVPVRYAVETNVNFADTFGIGVGKSVRLPATIPQD